MDRDHYLPAAYLGRFSIATNGPRRDRPIYVLDRDAGETAHRTTADHIAWLPDMYTLRNADEPRRVDDSWTSYEQRLMQALDVLAANGGHVDATQWLRVLIPFAAGLFVRGPDFGPRHDARLPPPDNLDQDDNNNQVRLVEQARLLAPLMAAVWAVFSFPGPTDLVTSDRGYGFVWHKDYGRGFAVPINSRQALVLLPNRRRVVLTVAKNKWRAPIDGWSPTDQAAHDINRSIASHALTTLIGPTASSVERYATEFAGESDLATEPFNSDWASSRVRRMHEWDWLRAVHVIGGRPSDDELVPDQLYDMDDQRFDKGWMPQLLLGLYSPDGSNRGLSRHGDDVGMALIEEQDLPPWSAEAESRPNDRARNKILRQRAAVKASRRANRK